MDKQLTFIDFFAGIGGFRRGLELAGMRCKGFCEKDAFAVRSYRAMYDTKGDWYGEDITRLRADEIPQADIWTAGSPCQNLSTAGKRAGLHGDRSGLFFNLVDLLKGKEERDKPEWVILENVKGLLSSNRGWDFLEYVIEVAEAGYDVEWQVLNSKDFGVPQNRERVYTVGHLRSKGGRKVLPVGTESSGNLATVVTGMQGYCVYDPKGISTTLVGSSGGLGGKTGLYLIDQSLSKPRITETARCITARYTSGTTKLTAMNSAVLEIGEKTQEGIKVRSATKLGYQTALPGDSVKLAYPNSNTHRGRVGKNVSQTLSCSGDMGAVVYDGKNVRIRRLTPKECFRLQGYPDELFERAAEVNSNAQLYKQAGNGVTVNVVHAIGKKILETYP
jgi:DNA (cytosine-5)-methyltransferase 1